MKKMFPKSISETGSFNIFSIWRIMKWTLKIGQTGQAYFLITTNLIDYEISISFYIFCLIFFLLLLIFLASWPFFMFQK